MPSNLQPLVNLWFPASLVQQLGIHGSRHAPRETGGVLVGYFVANGAVVTDAIGPGPKAKHGRFRFLPDADFHEAQIAQRYQQSGGVLVYLGDWHTHPRGGLTLSRLDRRTLRRIAGEPEARVDHPVMLILAGGAPWVPVAWGWHPAGVTPRRTRAPVRRLSIKWY